jgi:Ca2+-binding RTX toxin-like protein
MQGGAGNDLFIVSDAGDEATEDANAGYDIVRSTVSFSLGANIERLDLIGTGNLSGSGNIGNNIITGTEGDNRLNGESGADSLYADDGADTLDGGIGADRLVGGDGNDLYLVDDEADRVVEGRGEGLDTVRAFVTHSLAANVENLVLFSLAPTAMNGTGNVLANAITGTDGNNLLNGLDGADTLAGSGGNDTLKGGGGADSLNGGLGNDYFVVDDAGDRIAGTRDDGNDTVESGISWTLGANQEALTLTGFLSTRGVGNGSDNVITGSIGNNTLDGGGGNDSLAGGEGADSINGGAGADTMNGGAGDDAYVVDSTGDRVVETLADIGGPDPVAEDGDPADGGIDLVRSSVTFTLGANLENLTLTGAGASAGTGNGLANAMTGNGAANRLTAYAGNDVLDGGAGADTLDGGPGADTMTGGSEADSFLYATALTRLDGVDRIRDFTPGVDHIVFENAFFTGLPTTGTLADALFGLGATASLPGQRILYESATGLLRYDADGSGGANAPVTLAQLETNLAMTASDFIVI